MGGAERSVGQTDAASPSPSPQVSSPVGNTPPKLAALELLHLAWTQIGEAVHCLGRNPVEALAALEKLERRIGEARAAIKAVVAQDAPKGARGVLVEPR